MIESISVLRAFRDSTGGLPKLAKSDYLASGAFPIIDQGENRVAGFTDDPAAVVQMNLPVVLFGDHTRRFKYVDHPFALGADGVKVLEPSSMIDPKYGFHALTALSIPNAGYSRHFKFLKELNIPLPPLPEQRRIAAILDEADALRTKNVRLAEQVDALVVAEFRARFVDANAMTALAVEDLLGDGSSSIRTGPFGSQLLKEEFVAEGIPVLGIDNVVQNRFVHTGTRRITNEKYRQLQRYTVNPGDVLITIMGTVGRCAIVPDDIGVAINTKHLCCITLDRARCLPEYLRAYFLWHPVARQYLRSTSKGAIMDGLNMGIIRKMPVLVPPIEAQQEFVSFVKAAERAAGRISDARDDLETLFASLQHRAFTGQL